MTFPNMAGETENLDDTLASELKAAGIPVERLSEILRTKGEVSTITMGFLGKWKFERCWYYWRASGPGLPPLYADALHVLYGQEARVAGHCGCPSPFEWYCGFGVDLYHVDTPAALAALATALKACLRDAAQRNKEAS